MISRSHDYVEFCRENATHLKSLHDLALRGAGKEEITAAIHRRIVEETALQAGDDLVDIGCGDGTLLRWAEKIGARSALGFLATEEEVALGKGGGPERIAGFQRPITDTGRACVSSESR